MVTLRRPTIIREVRSSARKRGVTDVVRTRVCSQVNYFACRQNGCFTQVNRTSACGATKLEVEPLRALIRNSRYGNDYSAPGLVLNGSTVYVVKTNPYVGGCVTEVYVHIHHHIVVCILANVKRPVAGCPRRIQVRFTCRIFVVELGSTPLSFYLNGGIKASHERRIRAARYMANAKFGVIREDRGRFVGFPVRSQKSRMVAPYPVNVNVLGFGDVRDINHRTVVALICPAAVFVTANVTAVHCFKTVVFGKGCRIRSDSRFAVLYNYRLQQFVFVIEVYLVVLRHRSRHVARDFRVGCIFGVKLNVDVHFNAAVYSGNKAFVFFRGVNHQGIFFRTKPIVRGFFAQNNFRPFLCFCSFGVQNNLLQYFVLLSYVVAHLAIVEACVFIRVRTCIVGNNHSNCYNVLRGLFGFIKPRQSCVCVVGIARLINLFIGNVDYRLFAIGNLRIIAISDVVKLRLRRYDEGQGNVVCRVVGYDFIIYVFTHFYNPAHSVLFKSYLHAILHFKGISSRCCACRRGAKYSATKCQGSNTAKCCYC